MEPQVQREQWTSRLGFVVSAIGAAVGVGNVWRFPYLVSEYGGAAFLLIYFACIFLVGYPVMLTELSIGRQGQRDAVGSLRVLAPGTRWHLAGVLGVLGALSIPFFFVVCGWTLNYFFGYLTGRIWHRPPGGYAQLFEQKVTDSVEPVLWLLVVLVIVLTIIRRGVQRGLERGNKIMMPVLGISILLIAIYTWTLGSAVEGVRYLFTPNWSAFTDPRVYIAALGQSFFSLSLGMGTMITYGSYLDRSMDLPSSALTITVFDTIVSIVSSLIIFPALFAFGMGNESGPGLAFVAFPEIFNSIPKVGPVLGMLFFLMLASAALSSAIATCEVIVAYFIGAFNWPRTTATLWTGVVVLLTSIPVALSLGLLNSFRIFGLNLFDFTNVGSSFILSLAALFTVLFAGWYWTKSEFGLATGLKSGWNRRFLYWNIRWLAPAAIFIVLVGGIFGG